MNNNVKAIILALVASVSGVTMNVLIKFSLQDINVFTAGFLRFLFGFILILPFIFYNKFQNFKTPNLKIHRSKKYLGLLDNKQQSNIIPFIHITQEEKKWGIEEIEKRTGYRESDVIKIMRRSLKPSSFRLWRKRVHEKSIKHRKKFEYSRKQLSSKLKKSDYL